MKVDILNLEGNKTGTIDLPKQFNEEYRPDLIKKAVLVIQSNNRQPYGASTRAGKDYSAKLSRRRRKYKTPYGRGGSRMPRKTIWHRGTQFGWVGALAPGTIGGRRAHPPKAEKIWEKKLNIKERRKAIRSAITATLDKALIKKRGHLYDLTPLIIEDKFSNLEKTKDVLLILKKIGLEKELKRIEKKKVRAGKGKNRGRKYKIKKGPLIVVADKCNLEQSSVNLQGFDIVRVNKLNTELLAPGTDAGRLVIWTNKSIERLEKEKLFLDKEKNGPVQNNKKSTSN